MSCSYGLLAYAASNSFRSFEFTLGKPSTTALAQSKYSRRLARSQVAGGLEAMSRSYLSKAPPMHAVTFDIGSKHAISFFGREHRYV